MIEGTLSSDCDQCVDRAGVLGEFAGIRDRNAGRASNEVTIRRRQDLKRVVVFAFCRRD